uniref:Uncharacterized protein n=1 Tax=Plectus sambesii TaxID=2011161 RepID=A0A914XSF7_9BILA
MKLAESSDIAGTCGNGLQCSSKSLQQVDCFATLLSGRCIYTIDDRVFICIVAAIMMGTLGLFCCMCWSYCQPPQLTSWWARRPWTRASLRSASLRGYINEQCQ